MAFTFVPASDDRARFKVDIPVGDKTLTFDVPLLSFVSKEKFQAYRDWASKHTDEQIIADGGRPVEASFDFLIDLLDVDHAQDFIDGLVLGEKAQLWEEWNRRTNMPLGESSDSATS